MGNYDIREIKPLIVIPVYNHAAGVRDVAIRSLEVCPDVLVVDDGSTDLSGDAVKDMPVRLIRHDQNKGKGAAILTAVDEARRLGMSHIITVDADGQHDPADIPRFMALINKDPTAIVVGKRRFSGKNVPFSSRFGRVFSNFWLRVQTGCSLKDTQSGFRAYPIALFDHLKLYDRRYSFEIEVLVKAAWAGIVLREVDISVHYPERKKRVSHFQPFMDNLRLTVLNTKLTVRALLPMPHRRFAERDGESIKVSIFHPVKSLKTLIRWDVSPEKLALSCGLGVFLGTLPLIACQAIVTLAAANYLRLNKYAALGASQISNIPIVPAMCIEAGYFIRHGRFLTEISMKTLGYQCLERILEWIIGALILGPLMGLVAAVIIYTTTIILKKGKAAIVG
jgi:glycosyltransferase involved in cell wall biosynthesis